MSSATLTKLVPIFVAAMVWLVRLLIIGTFSLAGDRLFTTAQVNSYQSSYNNSQPRSTYQAPRPSTQYVNQPSNQPVLRPASQINRPVNAAPASSNTFRPAPKPVSSQQTSFIPPEPTYHPVSYESRSNNSNNENSSTRHYDA